MVNGSTLKPGHQRDDTMRVHIFNTACGMAAVNAAGI